MIIIEKTIEKTHFTLEVDETKTDDCMAGCPILIINDEKHLIQPVDALQIIKAIANSNNLIYVKKGITGCWSDETITKTLTRIEKEEGYI